VGRDGESYGSDFGQAGNEIFLQKGLDSKLVICPSRLGNGLAEGHVVGKIVLAVHD
jgi:hypothetical protein